VLSRTTIRHWRFLSERPYRIVISYSKDGGLVSIEIKERQFDYGPQRAAWTFNVFNKTIREAISRKLTHHKARHTYWTEELTKAEAEMKASVQIREHAITGGVQHTTVFDQEKATYVTTCKSKRDEHFRQLETFTAWWGLMRNEPGEQKHTLTIADAEFFGIGDVSD
jgi:hypothetical protein